MFVVPSAGKLGCSGGLAFLWKSEVKANLVSFSHSHIDMTVTCPDMFKITGFYRAPILGERQAIWNTHKAFKDRMDVSWVCGGDFNEIVKNSEKLGRADKSYQQMAAFREALDYRKL